MDSEWKWFKLNNKYLGTKYVLQKLKRKRRNIK